MADAKQLQVGDVIYRESNLGYVIKKTIDRVTAKRAFSETHKFSRVPYDNGYLEECGVGYSGWHIETPEFIEKCERFELRRDIIQQCAYNNVDKLTTDQMRCIIAIIEEKPGAAPSDLATGIPTLDRQHQ